MARRPTDKQLFKMKNEWLEQLYEEVKPIEFYRAVFPDGSFEREGHPEDEKCNGVLTVIEGEKARNYIVFDELNMVNEVKGKEFVIMSPVGYSGRNRTAKNARWLYGIVIDLDGVEMGQIRDLFYQMKNELLPQCTYCVNSGHGLHLYYLLEKPVPLYRHLQDQLREFKYELTAKIWNRYTSTYKERDQVQYQGIFQGFRMVGTQTKLGKRYLVTAFKTGERVTIEYLNNFLMDKSKAVTDFKYKSELSLVEAKKKYPEWYEKRIVKQEKKGRWHVKRDLYDWWLRKLQSGEVSVGHRYWCLSVLASYGIKCDIPEDEVLTDALELLPMFDLISDDEHNRFTKRDVLDAMNMYQENYVTYSRAEVERVSGISIPPNKRNGRKQAEHIKLMNFVRDEINGNKDWRNKDGRPDKAKIVEEWQENHTDGKKVDCIRDTGLSKPTVYKWWNDNIQEKSMGELKKLIRELVDYENEKQFGSLEYIKSKKMKLDNRILQLLETMPSEEKKMGFSMLPAIVGQRKCCVMYEKGLINWEMIRPEKEKWGRYWKEHGLNDLSAEQLAYWEE